MSSSIYTRDINKAFTAMRDLQTGITYINAGTTGAEVHLPFGGTKQTGKGHREAGQAALDVFTEWKSVYVDYAESSSAPRSTTSSGGPQARRERGCSPTAARAAIPGRRRTATSSRTSAVGCWRPRASRSGRGDEQRGRVQRPRRRPGSRRSSCGVFDTLRGRLRLRADGEADARRVPREERGAA